MFSKGDNFSKIFHRSVTVSDVIHAAKIKVNEEGAEAAGVTAIMGLESVSLSFDHVLNREFGFFIVDFNTRMILFSGVYRKPENK